MSKREKADRKLLEAFLKRLDETAALSCPGSNLVAAIEDVLKEKR